MLKAMLPLSTFVGLLWAVPTVVDDSPRTLTGALSDTVRALEVLRGYEALESSVIDVGAVRSVTEGPIADPAVRLARLDQLHTELQRMQLHLELLRSGAGPASTGVTFDNHTPPVPTLGLRDGDIARFVAASRRPAVVEGVSEAATQPNTPTNGAGTPAIQTPGSRSEPNTPPAVQVPTANDPAASPAPRDESFAFAKARAAFFAGQYDVALVGFEAGPDDVRDAYWRARCLEQLGRFTEALDLYDRVTTDPNAGELLERARSDADFLRWKIEFEQGSKGQ